MRSIMRTIVYWFKNLGSLFSNEPTWNTADEIVEDQEKGMQ